MGHIPRRQALFVVLEAFLISFFPAILLPGAVIANLGIRIWRSLEEFEDIVHCGTGNVVQGFLCQVSLMGGDDHIRHGDQPHQLVITDDVARIILIK